jgi:hypothetical protein
MPPDQNRLAGGHASGNRQFSLFAWKNKPRYIQLQSFAQVCMWVETRQLGSVNISEVFQWAGILQLSRIGLTEEEMQ